MSEKKLKLFEITMTAFKTLYVEAENELDALCHSVVEEEQETNSISQRFGWEFEDGKAEECPPDEEKIIRDRGRDIVKDEEHEE